MRDVSQWIFKDPLTPESSTGSVLNGICDVCWDTEARSMLCRQHSLLRETKLISTKIEVEKVLLGNRLIECLRLPNTALGVVSPQLYKPPVKKIQVPFSIFRELRLGKFQERTRSPTGSQTGRWDASVSTVLELGVCVLTCSLPQE